MCFELNISKVLAHSIVFFTKLELSPNGIVDDARNEDPSAPSTSRSASKIATAFTQQLPRILGAITGGIAPTEQGIVDASKQVSPQWAELQNLLYNTFGRDINRIGSEIDAENAMASSESDVARLAGPGRDIANI